VYSLNLKGQLLSLDYPKVMGILNATPDSFFAGSRVEGRELLQKAEQMLAEGADILDVGAMSTRPGAHEIPESEELAIATEAISALSNAFPQAILSIDTYRSQIAKAALDQGAHIVNDVSGGQDPVMFNLVGHAKVPYILTHNRGNARTMGSLQHYDNLLLDMKDFFLAKMGELKAAGCPDVILDPGFGFAKNTEQNFQILSDLHWFSFLGAPILAGLSRKGMIWKTLNTNPDSALNGTTVLNTIALQKGAHILRVHDVLQAKEAIALVQTLKDAVA
jgi:dihydropteroate synthase